VLDSRYIVTRRLLTGPITRPIALLHRRERSLSPAAQTFRDFLCEYVKSPDGNGIGVPPWRFMPAAQTA
jgi:DNA-binding transcriptional LysR family regulator